MLVSIILYALFLISIVGVIIFLSNDDDYKPYD